jgi:amino-acid N-acetyltransferase
VTDANRRELQPADLRGILKYVPMWRDHTFVVALDGAVFEEDNFAPLLVELAVLHNLGIRLVLVFGISEPLRRRARERGVELTDLRGDRPVDAPTLDLAIETAGVLQHQLVRGASLNGMRCAVASAVRATERGILGGVDHGLAGKVDRVDLGFLSGLLDQRVVPILGPIAFGRDGQPRRLNSDELASAVAEQLSASKLIFMMTHPGLTFRGEFQLNLSVELLEQRVADDPEIVDEVVRSKATWAVRTIRRGVPRAHLLDVRLPDALLTEIFSTVGVGTMIHANPYAQIRPARPADASSIHRLTKSGVKDETLRVRSRDEVERQISEYVVYEIDESIVGCCRLSPLDSTGGDQAELASVFVHHAYAGRGLGRALVAFALESAKTRGYAAVYALTTQTAPFFVDVCGFREVDHAQAPPELVRRATGRQSRIFVRRP